MNWHNKVAITCCVCAAALMFCAESRAQQSTDPAVFTSIIEIPLHGKPIPVTSPVTEVDHQSTIRIHFDASRMAVPRPLRPDGPARPAVNIRVEAYSIKGSSRTQIVPIHPYVDRYIPPGAPSADAAEKAAAEGTGTQDSGTIVFHDKFFDPDHFATIPDADITLLDSDAASADSIELQIINLRNQQVLKVVLIPQALGFHFKASDTLMFVKRLGIGTKEKQAGISDFNFGPAPGVAYGGTYFARKNAFLRFLQPGAGINVMFTKWDNPSFDVSTGQFVPGTKGSDIQTAMGGQVTLFGNVIQLGYGANLQVDQKRAYFGVGVSFVNLTTKLAGLISK